MSLWDGVTKRKHQSASAKDQRHRKAKYARTHGGNKKQAKVKCAEQKMQTGYYCAECGGWVYNKLCEHIGKDPNDVKNA